MEISPISGIRQLPVLKARSPEAEFAALSDIEQMTPIGDETYTPSDGKPAAGAEDDTEDDEDDLLDPPEPEEPDQTATFPSTARNSRPVSFFA